MHSTDESDVRDKRSAMLKKTDVYILFWISLVVSIPAFSLFNVPDTDFEENFSEAVTYDTKSLLRE